MTGLPVIAGALLVASPVAPIVLGLDVLALTLLAARGLGEPTVVGVAWAVSAWLVVTGAAATAVRGLPDVPAALVVVAVAVVGAVLMDEARGRLVAA